MSGPSDTTRMSTISLLSSDTLDNEEDIEYDQSSSDKESFIVKPVQLKRQINLVSCIAISVGMILGSGIFISPKGVLMNTGSAGVSLIVWVVCGAVSMMGAFTFAELATTLRQSGGSYTYLNETYGEFVAFLSLWISFILLSPGGCAIAAMTFAKYAVYPFSPENSSNIVAVKVLSFLCIATTYTINLLSVRATTRVQIVFTTAKVAGLGIIIASGLMVLMKGHTQSFHNSFETTNTSFYEITLAFYSGIYAFVGWESVVTFTEEIQNPKRNIPITLIFSLILVTLLYLLANVSYFAAMSPKELLDSDTVALTFGKNVLGSWYWLMAVVVATSAFGSLLAQVLALPRIFFVGGRNGHLPSIFSMIHSKFLTPVPALLFEMFVTFLLLIPNDIYFIINCVSFSLWLFNSLTASSLIFLRWKKPNLERPFKVPIIIPIIFVMITTANLIFSMVAAPLETFIGICILLTGVPVFILGVKWKHKPKKLVKFWGNFTEALQKWLSVVPQGSSSLNDL